MKVFLLTFTGILLFFAQVHAQTTYTTAADGNWSSASTWAGGVVPTGSTTADSISILHNVTADQNLGTVNAAVTIAAGKILTVATGINFFKGSSRPFILNGTLDVKGFFRNTGASAYGQGVTSAAGSFIVIAGRVDAANYWLCDGAVTIAAGGRINGGGNLTLRNGLTNNGYINLTSAMVLYKNVINNDTLRITTLTLEDCIFRNDTRAFLNNGTDLFIRDTSTFINTDSSFLNNFGRVTITQASNFINEDSARIRITSSFNIWDSSKYTGTTVAEFFSQGTLNISRASEFNNSARFNTAGGAVNITGLFMNNTGAVISSNGTINVLNTGLFTNKATITTTAVTINVNAGGLFTNEATGVTSSNNTFNIFGVADNKGSMSGIISVATGGTVNNFNAATVITNGNFNVNGTINNNGLITSSALNLSTAGIVNNNNLATYNFANGTATISGVFNRNGGDNIQQMRDIRGTGTFAGNFEPAVLYPATNSTTGIFNVSGNFTILSSSSGVQINVNGNTAGTGHDRVLVSGTMNLGGGTLLTTFNYTPAADTVLTIIKSSSLAGNFAQFSPALPAKWNITYNTPATGDVSLVYSNSPLSTRNEERLTGIKIYIAETDLYIKGTKEKFELLILSVDGRIVFHKQFAIPANNVSRVIWANKMNSGVYLVKVITSKGYATEKIILQR